jgi:hypothetical protein
VGERKAPALASSVGAVIVSDAETVEFLITKAVGRLWSRVLTSENVERDLVELRSHNPGSLVLVSANVFSLSSMGHTG